MKTTMFVALALAISTGPALANSPELGRPFGDGFTRAPAATNVGSAPALSDDDVRTRLQRDGYRAISPLTRGADGSWHGTAVRGAAKLHVSVDPQGRISVR